MSERGNHKEVDPRHKTPIAIRVTNVGGTPKTAGKPPIANVGKKLSPMNSLLVPQEASMTNKFTQLAALA